MNRGITLTEFLIGVVIFIIIALIGFMFRGNLQERARDNARLSEMNKIKQGLAIYHKQQTRYPPSRGQTVLTGNDAVSVDIEHELGTIEIFPDPLHPEFRYTYQSDIRGTTYSLRFCLEGISTDEFSPGCNNFIRP